MILHEQFIRTAKKYPKKLAIIDCSRNSKVPYAKALIAALILAKKFKKYKEGYIGVMIPTSAGAMLATIGVVMAGKVPVMINYSTGAAENCEYGQNMCGFKTIISSKALVEKINCPHVPGMVFLEDVMKTISTMNKLGAALRSKLSAAAIIKSLPSTKPDDNAVILFTSGSEKDPKGVQLTHRNFSSNIADLVEAFRIEPSDSFMSILPLFHVFGHNANFWLPLITGMTTITYANPLDYKKVPELCRKEKPTLMVGTPSFFSGYLRNSKEGDFSSIRLMLAGADKTPQWLRDAYMEKHGINLLEGYGATETSPAISVNSPFDYRAGSIGKVMKSAQVKVVGVQTDKEVGVNEEGKILVKGDLVMKGYFDNLEETALRIHDGWYDTGDIGRMDEDGFLWHHGRLKRFVKIGGEMVSLVRTETVLEEFLPDGVDCCVVEIPDAIKGARIVVAITEQVKEKEILKNMAKKLPAIALPKKFVVMESLPKMGSGKIDFRTVTDLVKEALEI